MAEKVNGQCQEESKAMRNEVQPLTESTTEQSSCFADLRGQLASAQDKVACLTSEIKALTGEKM